MGSSTSTDVAGFRVGAELGRGRRTVVYEAFQLDLERRVALKLLPAGERTRLQWPEHPRVVSLYASGACDRGRYVAMQLVRGPTLAQLLEGGGLAPARALELLADVASALDAAHESGIAHGAVAGRNVLVEENGRALLSDFGLGSAPPTVAADQADFAALVRDALGDRAVPPGEPPAPGELVRHARAMVSEPPPPRRRRRAALAAAVVAGVAAVVAIAAADGRDDGVPPPAPGAVVLGSDLAGDGVSSLDCAGQRPSGASNACTVVQTHLPGRRLVPAAAGAIRRWTVRGAHGELALQVVRRRAGGYTSAARSSFVRVPGPGVHVEPADLPVRPGDLIGVQLAPGAAIGVRRDARGATTARWLGQLFLEPRPIELPPGSGFDHEILLRVEYARGAPKAAGAVLAGRAARGAPAGRPLHSVTIEVRNRVRRVTAVRLRDGVAVDLLAGGRRLARAVVEGADPAGRLLNLTSMGAAAAVVTWRNRDGRTFTRTYTLGPRTLTPRG